MMIEEKYCCCRNIIVNIFECFITFLSHTGTEHRSLGSRSGLLAPHPSPYSDFSNYICPTPCLYPVTVDVKLIIQWMYTNLIDLFHSRHFHLLQQEKHRCNKYNGSVPFKCNLSEPVCTTLSSAPNCSAVVIYVSSYTFGFPAMTCQNVLSEFYCCHLRKFKFRFRFRLLYLYP